jgi:hypothetical protein
LKKAFAAAATFGSMGKHSHKVRRR